MLDPRNTAAVDNYEIPRRIRDAMFLRMPASCFPYATTTGRLELDHTKAYIPPARGGPPGQTGVHNLGPLLRFEHSLGDGPFARRLWRAATPAKHRVVDDIKSLPQ